MSTHNPGLRLSDSEAEIVQALSDWHEALRAVGQPTGKKNTWWLPAYGFAIHLEDRKQKIKVPGADLSTDQDCDNVIVEVNPGSMAGSSNPGTGIAIRQGTDERWIVRQGVLNAKNGKDGVTRKRFSALSTIAPLSVHVPAQTNLARAWYPVCPLHIGQPAIWSETARFVHMAAWMREHEAQPADGQVNIEEKDGTESEAGALQYSYSGTDGGIARRLEEEVVRALEMRLWPGVRTRRPDGVEGYKADLEVISAKILIEAKVSVLPSYVQQGIGQLFLYPHLVEGVASHRRVLLVPRGMKPKLADAVRQNGITIATYWWTGGDLGVGTVHFDPPLLTLCQRPQSRSTSSRP